MNNFDVGRFPAMKLSLCAVLLAGMLSNVVADTQYGPLRPGESLSRIVNQNYLASPYDNEVIMKEILRLNPQAFINNNMGLIKQGVMLTLPSDASIGRAQQQNNSTTAVLATPVTSAEPRPRVRIQTIQETLRQMRNERDEASLRASRIQTESLAKLESLDTKVAQLETEKESVTQRLSRSDAEIATLKQLLQEIRHENSQLVAKSEQLELAVGKKDEFAKQLEESKQAITDKQQQIAKLELTVNELKSASDDLKLSHESAINSLQLDKKSLEENISAQTQVENSNDVSVQIEAKIAELNLKHQQQLNDLQASLDAKVRELSIVPSDTTKLEEELQTAKSESKKLKEELTVFQSAIAKLKLQHESDITALKSEHQQVVNDLNASFDTQLAEKAKSQTGLTEQLAEFKDRVESNAEEIAILTHENSQLLTELSETKSSLETLSSSQAQLTEQDASSEESLNVNAAATEDATKTLISGPITQQMIVERLGNPVEFPFWGLLLAAFALGFTSLMLLFNRRDNHPISESANTQNPDIPPINQAEEENLVFRAADPSVQDPDIETLRVPPRRDPSRVAILDPTMAASATATTALAGLALDDNGTPDQLPTTQQKDSVIKENDEFEAKLKLLMAETYEELGDSAAANELLLEVRAAKHTTK